ncbi:hypothetical protein J3F83DRAFT_751557 [Trichoderma novae-zelandiae]
MTQPDEDAISSALNDIKNGTSQRKAAQRWGVARTTLQKCINRRRYTCNHAWSRVLSEMQQHR